MSGVSRPRPGRAAGRRYWLFKSEPDVYSIEDLERDGRTCWEGVRNYQARNFLRDEIRIGDRVLFYHSNAKPLAVVGIAEVVRAGYPDHTAFEATARYYDPDSDPEAPTWFMVDIEFVARFAEPVTRSVLADDSGLAEMMLLQRGSRLSIQPVTAQEWRRVLELGGARDD
jgi:predicted RNA-binding protein with PUA-like domain